MARYRVQGPDGKVYVFEGPDGASAADVEAFAATQFGGKAARVKAQQDADRARYNPTEGTGTVQRLAEGAGSGIASVLRALNAGPVLRAMGLPDTKAEADRLDKPLTDTTAGTVGRVVGQAAPAALAIPFTPATLPGAVVAGAATGGALTEGGVVERGQAALGGAAGGALGHYLPNVVRAARGAWRGLTEPLTTTGRDRIAGRAIARFATNPDALDNLAAGPSITGARPTLAEATGDPGLASLQRAVSTMDPEAAALIAAREAENNAARVATLRAAAGEGTAPVQSSVRRLRQIQAGPTRQAAETTRTTAANASYGAAREAGVDAGMADALQPQIAALMERPEIQRAATQARALARSEGLELGDNLGSVQGLQYLKQALDDEIAGLPPRAANARRLYTTTSENLKSVLDDVAPTLRQADREFAGNSVPINRQDVAARLLESATPERDMLGNRTLRVGSFARALNDEQSLIKQATGFGGAGNSLDDLLTATNAGRVQAVRSELETLASMDKAANGKGSQTAKMLASQNLLRQVAGPLGLPEGFVSNVIADTALRPLAFGIRAAEDRVGRRMGEAALDPTTALTLVQGARAFDAGRAVSPLEQQLRLLLQRSAPAAIGLGAANASSQ